MNPIHVEVGDFSLERSLTANSQRTTLWNSSRSESAGSDRPTNQRLGYFCSLNAVIKMVVLLGALLFGHLATATEWDELSAGQQRVLGRFQDQWAEFEPGRRTQLAQGADNWLAMDADQRRQVGKRFQRWQQLTPDQRQTLTTRFQEFKQLSPDQQRRLRERMQRFKQLPPARQRELRTRFRDLSPQDRARALDRMKRATPRDGTRGVPKSPPTRR